MKSTEVTVRDMRGLHLTPSAKIVRCAQQFRSRIVLCHRCKQADACSILQVLSLGASFGARVKITATGEDEKQAISDIERVFQDGEGI